MAKTIKFKGETYEVHYLTEEDDAAGISPCDRCDLHNIVSDCPKGKTELRCEENDPRGEDGVRTCALAYFIKKDQEK